MAQDRNIRDLRDAWEADDEQYLEQRDRMEERLEEKAEEQRSHINLAARETKEQVKDSERYLKEKAKDELQKVKNRHKTFGDSVDAELDHAKEAEKEVRKEIREESRRVRNSIEDRKDRFDDGLDRIEGDLTTDYYNTRTSSMDSHGNYLAADDRGTVNNYIDQIEYHAEKTEDRMKRDMYSSGKNLDRGIDDINPIKKR